jgi:hypothetical protein
VLPREIGLVGLEDPLTSWGVNLFAEAVWNFGVLSIAIAVPLFFWIAHALDGWAARWIRIPGIAWLVGASLFFHSLSIGSILNSTTFVLWVVVVGKVIASFVRPDVAARVAPPQGARG